LAARPDFVEERDLAFCPQAGDNPSRYTFTLQVKAEASWDTEHPGWLALAPGESLTIPMEFRLLRAVPNGTYGLRWSSGEQEGAFDVTGPSTLAVQRPCTDAIILATITARDGEEGSTGGIHPQVDWGWGFEGWRRYSQSTNSPRIVLRQASEG
jgi:hypothetical protein